ncbi:MAG TPA: hypothetical protein VM677_28665 [Actinokineospora sp.]|nr:hypothetical protein [Actinokineospora sp.]
MKPTLRGQYLLVLVLVLAQAVGSVLNFVMVGRAGTIAAVIGLVVMMVSLGIDLAVLVNLRGVRYGARGGWLVSVLTIVACWHVAGVAVLAGWLPSDWHLLFTVDGDDMASGAYHAVLAAVSGTLLICAANRTVGMGKSPS